MVSTVCAGIAAVLTLYVLWEAWTAYSLIDEKLKTTIEGLDNNPGLTNWGNIPNTPDVSPAYLFIGNVMDKTDLTECENVYNGITVSLADRNVSDDLNPLEDFTGVDAVSGVVPLEKVCRTGVIGSSLASFPCAGIFEYPTCTSNCDMYFSTWGGANYGIDVVSTAMIGGVGVGVYAIDSGVKATTEDTWGNLMGTAGDHVTRIMWCLPVAIVLGLVACFAMEADQPDSEMGQELSQS